jgi:transcription-repair coupling factor (superfamily II helicase)
MRDLEIRGAGNLLGTEQSGHIIAVGFDLYCKMLKRAVDSVHGKKSASANTTLRFDFVTSDEAAFVSSENRIPSFIPLSYITDPRLRIEAYRRIAEAGTRAEADQLRLTWRDRFGPVPPAAENALTCAAIRIEASLRKIPMVEVRDDKLMITKGDHFIMIGARFPRLTLTDTDSRLQEVLNFLENLPNR